MVDFLQQNWIEIIVSLIVGLLGGTLIEFKFKIVQKIYKKSNIKQITENSPNSPTKIAGENLLDKSVNIQELHIHNIHIGKAEQAIEVNPIENNPKEESSSSSLNGDHYAIISKIDQIHSKNGKSDWSFTNDLVEYLTIKAQKSNKCWYFSAASHLAQCIQDLGPQKFFDSFVTPEEERKKKTFEYLRSELTASYHNEIQKMRHTDKDGTLKNRFISKNDLEKGKEDLPEQEMENILDTFYKNLENLLKIADIS